MSTLWTPDGERPVRREPPRPSTPPTDQGASGQGPADSAQGGQDAGGEAGISADEAAQLAALREQLARTPAAVIVANHAFGLFELAALHLSSQPPGLDDARLAIDGLGALVDGLAGRLGEAEPQLADGLAQLRMAFVQISAAARAQAEPPPA
jgi:hypothetical protein